MKYMDDNEMWRRYHEEMRQKSVAAGRRAGERIKALVAAGLIEAKWHTEWHVTLTNPKIDVVDDRLRRVEFFPTRGTIVTTTDEKGTARQQKRGLWVALKLIGVHVQRGM